MMKSQEATPLGTSDIGPKCHGNPLTRGENFSLGDVSDQLNHVRLLRTNISIVKNSITTKDKKY